MANDKTTELVQGYYDSWKNGTPGFDATRLRTILAPDLRFEGPIAGKRDRVEPFLMGLADFASRLKGYRSLQQVFAGDQASALYDCDIGASSGTLRFAEFFRVRDDRIQEIKLVYDAAEFRKLTAPPE